MLALSARHTVSALLSGALLTGLAACATDPQLPASEPPATLAAAGFDASALSSTVRPQDDFFAYVNQRWIDATEIPPDRTSFGVFTEVFDRTELQVRAIIEGAAEAQAAGQANAAEQRIGSLFASFMNTAEIERRTLQPLQDLFAEVAAVSDPAQLPALFGRLQHLNIDLPLAFFIETDADDPTRNLLYFWQGGLGLPDRDYYLRDDARFAAIREAYLVHIERMHTLAGWSDGAAAAQTVLHLEHDLAERQWSRVQNRDRARIYSNKVPASELRTSPFWRTLFDAADFGHVDTVVLAQDDYLEALPEFIAATPLEQWQTYTRFKILASFAPLLHEAIVTENFDFRSRTLRGQQEQRPRWKRGVALVNGGLGEQVGEAYVTAHFPPSAKAKIAAMVDDLAAAFDASIRDLSWMSAATKRAAKAKLDAFDSKLGYPEQWRDYSDLTLVADDLVGNARRARQFENARMIGKLHKPVDRSEWGMTPQTINAYYRPTYNEIVFPAAILQPPFFDPQADAAFNYGAIGAVIGHEFSHGFDDQGRKFDGAGRLRDWWTDADSEHYMERANRLVAQYNAYQPLPDVAINGELTLGENIGDLAGLTMAYRAYQRHLGGVPAPVIEGVTGSQRFFLGYARAWRGKQRDETLRERLLSDPHSPGKYRVIGVLRNLDAYYEAFDVGPGDSMFLPPAERVRIW